MTKKENIIIYKGKDGKTSLEVNLEKETVWLRQSQIAELFGIDRTVATKHIKNIINDEELAKNSVCANFAHTASDGKTYNTNFYNLDMIISVGYRANSKKATHFRIWATSVLRDHIVKGYTVNQRRLSEVKLDEFEKTFGLIKQTVNSKKLSHNESDGLLKIITDYTDSWLMLQKYDEDSLDIGKGKKDTKELIYSDIKNDIEELKKDLIKKKEATDLFARERENHFEGILGNIYQTFSGKDLYPTIESKAAHLLYFVIKDHPFSDGNKRTGAFLFILFLARNKYLYNKMGERKFNNNALVALALLIAGSDPKQKETMIKLVMNFISQK